MREKTPNNYVEGLPRVSEIVDYFYPFPRDAIPKEKLDFAIMRGKLVHGALESYIDSDEFQLNQYVEALKTTPRGTEMFERGVAVLKKLKPKITAIQSEFYQKNNFYQGTIDVYVVKKNGTRLLLDWKTGTQAHESNLFQMWLYRKLVDVASVKDMVLIYLYDNKIVSYQDQNKKYNLDQKFSEMYELWLNRK